MQVFRTLVETTKGIKGAKVENHKFCTSVHYRNVDESVRIRDRSFALLTNNTLLTSLANSMNFFHFSNNRVGLLLHNMFMIFLQIILVYD